MSPELKAIYLQLLKRHNIVRRTETTPEHYAITIIGPAPGEYVPAVYYLRWLYEERD